MLVAFGRNISRSHASKPSHAPKCRNISTLPKSRTRLNKISGPVVSPVLNSSCASLSSTFSFKSRSTLLQNPSRFYSTGSKHSVPIQQQRRAVPLSAALRKFYLKVHPDLFGSHVKEQKTNENSFKILTEYLELYKQEEDSSAVYKLDFFVRDPETDNLKSVSASLSLPSKHSSAQAREIMLKNNLTKLFRQCGYLEEIDVSGYGSANKKLRSAGDNEVSLLNVVMAASSRFNASPSAKKSPGQIELEKAKETMRKANQVLQDKLLRSHKLKFQIEIPAIYFKTPTDRLNMIKKWLNNLDSALKEIELEGHNTEHIKGNTIIFAFRKQGPIGKPGIVYLEMNEPRSSWIETLKQLSPQANEELKAKYTEKANLEETVAKLMNIKKIESDVGVSLKHLNDYISFLQRLVMHINAKPDEWKTLPINMNGITVRIIEKISGTFAAEMATGTIFFPIGHNVMDLHTLLAKHGKEFVAQNRNLETAITLLKERYNLANLVISTEVEAEHIIDSLNRFIDGHHLLKPYLNGLNICVGNEYSVNEESKILFIKWDFLF